MSEPADTAVGRSSSEGHASNAGRTPVEAQAADAGRTPRTDQTPSNGRTPVEGGISGASRASGAGRRSGGAGETTRRDFLLSTLKGTAALAAAPWLGRWPARARFRARQADAHIEVLAGEPIGTIAPEIYGHFVEHLGGVVYDGIWVGEDSSVPNVGGIRKALVDAFRAIGPGVIRWPGGCFADAYDWRDGVGPREERPTRTNFWANDPQIRELGDVPTRFDPNRFGTNEFMHFCRLVGAEPYLAANVRTLPPRAFFEWIEYCNSPAGSTTLAELRGAGGDPEPFGVRYWGIGNESWGCGGNFTPEEYAGEYRRFTTWAVPNYGMEPRFVAAGPSGNDRDWTRGFFEKLAERRALNSLWGWSMHHYCSSPDGEAVDYSDRAWYELLASANRMDGLITSQWGVMGEIDRRHRVKLVVDEWGAWHRMTTNVDATHLFGQQSTIRDALVAGLTLDTFNRHADKVAMANIAQLVNCIQSLFLADEDRFVVTPTYHVFAMYAAHRAAMSLRTVVSSPRAAWTDEDGNEHALQGLDGSASVRDDVLTLTVTNRYMDRPVETEIALRDATIRSATATTLTAQDIRAVNTFDRPDTVAPTSREVSASGGSLVYRFPAASVTALQFRLGSMTRAGTGDARAASDAPATPERRRARVSTLASLVLAALCMVPASADAQQGGRRRPPRDTVPTLGLEGGVSTVVAPHLQLELVKASQTVAGLRPRDSLQFDFTPGDWLERRASNGHFHLGDLNLRLRTGSGDWRSYSTAAARQPVRPLAASGDTLAAADLAPTLPADIPLRVRRYWEVHDGHLALRFELRNEATAPVEIGALGIPLVFDNILAERSLDEAHVVASFHDPYIGEDAGYVQVTRLNGAGPALVVVPLGATPFEAWRPLLSEGTRRLITFEGFYEWMAHSRAYAENEWSEAEPWNPPTSFTLAPGQSRSYGVVFLVAPAIRRIEETLLANDRPVAVGVPGYVIPMDIDAKLFLKHSRDVRSIRVEPAGALTFEPAGTTEGGWRAYDVRGRRWGRARATVVYADGTRQAIHYKVIEPAARVVGDLGRFLTTQQWFEDADDPFGRSPSVISYDYDEGRQVTEDNRAWIAGLSDEGGAGSWLAAVMKQLIRPDAAEIEKLQRFIDGVLWGGIQYADGELKYGVRKSMFYYEPDEMPGGTYSDSVGYGGWSSWNREHAMTVGRSYDYPHVAAAYWVFYRLAREHRGLVTNHPWEWYLEHAYETSQAMVRLAAPYARFGQMEGTIFVLILEDLRREGWTEQADALEATMRARAEVWRSLGYPYGSEMPWDSTGQEEVYAWCRFFGFDEKAAVTLNAILGYMPTLPHWAYNGSARRYWDFLYAGKLRRIERQLHHYGSGINAIPVLAEYRSHPDDVYLLRVGYGGMLGSIANITQDGFGPAAFHAYPSTLRIDGYSGDYGTNFFGHAVNAATYVVHHPELGWLAFGGNVTVESATKAAAEPMATAAAITVRVEPRDAARSRVYLAPLGLWLTLDAGTFQSVTLSGDEVRITLAPATPTTPRALLRIAQPAQVDGVGRFAPVGRYDVERGASVVPLGGDATEVVLRAGG